VITLAHSDGDAPRAAETLAANLESRPFIERKTALNMAQMSRGNADLNLTSDQLEGLVNTLIVRIPLDLDLEYAALTHDRLKLRKPLSRSWGSHPMHPPH
jgi:hypothetical protein